jgi:hypothetical protein
MSITLLTVIFGIARLGFAKNSNPKTSTHIMILRIVLQGIVILLVGAMCLIA